MNTIKLLGMALFISLPLHAVAASVPVDKDIVKDIASLRQQSCPGDATNVESLENNIETDGLYTALLAIKKEADGILNTGLYAKAIQIAPKYADCQNSDAWAAAINEHLYEKQGK